MRRLYYIVKAILIGSMVKRSRHRPFTAVTRVRFPVESPRKKKNTFPCSSFFLRAPDGKRTRTRFNFQSVISYARRVRARRALRHTRNKPIMRINLLSQSPGGVTFWLLHRSSHPCLKYCSLRFNLSPIAVIPLNSPACLQDSQS